MNRKKLMIYNFGAVILTTIINIVFGMIEVSLFISKYGVAVNGLKQTGTQLLSYLSLIEAGIGASYVYNMYSPIAVGDYKKISELYAGFKKSIRIAVVEMLLVALLISSIYPLVINDSSMTYQFMVSVFALLSIKAILPYLISYVPKYMIIAKEHRYKTELISGITNAITYFIEIVLITKTTISIQLLLVVCICISLVSGIVFYITMKKLYSNKISKQVQPDVSPKNMSKDVLAHNISGLVFNSTDNVVISILSTLKNVTIYSNYNLIVNQVSVIFQKVYDGVTASLGIKIINKDSNSYSIYREMLSFTLFIASFISTVFMVMINDFVTLWVGEELIVGKQNVFLFGFILYYSILLPCISSARNACGLYKESKNFTIIQTIINLIITIVLVPKMGLTGALLGTFIARGCVSIPCNYFLVYKEVFPNHQNNWKELLSGPILVLILVILEVSTIKCFRLNDQINYNIAFLINTIISTIMSFACCLLFYYFSDNDFRRFVKKSCGIVRNKLKNEN